MAVQLTKGKLFDLFGKQYRADDFTNLTPKILDCMQRRLLDQPSNPLNLVTERIRHFFKDKKPDNIGYKYGELSFKSPVVTLEDNFDSLLIPKNHVSRSKSDTYYVDSEHLLRSHTSAHQSHCLKSGSRAFISVADCYRRDEIDRSHFPVFHQCELFKLYNHKEAIGSNSIVDDLFDKTDSETKTKQGVYSQDASSFAEAKLKQSVEEFVKNFFNKPDLKTRWVDAYFPFTHPSFELEIYWRDKWLEVLGCGVVRHKILERANICDHIGFAAGFGLERFGMLKYEIPDIRLFWSKDTGFTHQFENKSPFDELKFKEFSNCPQCINDLSFWLASKVADGCDSSSFCPNDFYDLCRDVAGDLVEQVRLIDQFTHPKTKRTSHCYRIIYRAADRVLTKDEVNMLHNRIAARCCEQFNVEIRA